MRKMILASAALTLAALVGCQGGTTGGPGAEKKDKSRLEKLEDKVRQGEETFSLTVPTLATKVKQGEAKEVAVGIKRGKNFDEDVSLKLEDLPKGVTVEPAAPAIKHGEEGAKLTFKAAQDAAVGDFTVKVVGHPTKGADATNEFKLTVEKK